MNKLATFLLLAMLAGPARALSYAEWVGQFPSIAGEAAAPGADPDADGLANAVEYALDGMDPTSANTGATDVFLQVRAEDGSYEEPAQAVTPAERAAAASLHVVVRWKPRAGTEGVAVVPQTSQKDLQHWGWGDSAIVEWDSGGYRWARAKSDAKVWAERAFIRLKVVLP